jgi:hypothetical protein
MMTPVWMLVAAILPPVLDDWKKLETPAAPVVEPRPVAQEYGLLEAEAGKYGRGKAAFILAAYRLKDSTGAVALEQALRQPGGARRVFRHRNYVFESVEGTAPRGAIDAFLLPALPKTDQSATVDLLRYLPAKGRIPGSERYILGPESLKAYAGRIPPGAAGFEFAGELQAAEYLSPEGGAWLGLFRYPNQLIARQQAEALERALQGIPTVALKREGPLVAVVLPAKPDGALKAETAQALTNPIVYKAEVVMDKKPPKEEDDPILFILALFRNTGILLGLCFSFGLAFALGLWLYRNQWRKDGEGAVTTLGI